MTFKVTNSYSRDNLNYKSGTVKNIHYGDIHTKFQTLFDLEKENVPYINEDVSLNRISEDFYCQEGDIIFADASEDLNDVGKSIEITNLNGEKLLSGLHTLIARPQKNNFSKGFLGYLLKSDFVRNQIKREAQGSKVLSINVGRISNIHLSFPSISEQQKISEFLALLDKRILYSIKIILHYQSLIQNIRNDLFKQKIMFKNEKRFSKWKVTTLGNIAEKSTTKNKAVRIKTVLSNSASFGIINQTDFFDKEIANKNNIKDYYIVEKDDFVYNPRISKEAPVGPISRNKLGVGIMSPLYMVFRFKEENIDYLEQFFYSNIWFEHMESIANYGARADRMSFSNNDFFKMPVPIPEIPEQKQIASLLSKINQKIQIEKAVLEGFKVQKKYLLQQMFI